MKIDIEIRVKSGQFREAREQAGFKTQREAAAALETSITTISAIENFRYYPKTPWVIEKYERILGRSFEELFPEEFRSAVDVHMITSLKFNRELIRLPEFRDDLLLPSAEDTYIEKEKKEMINESLKQLTEREAKVLRLRFGLDGKGERTFEEIGEVFKVTRERIRQIEAKALRKLKHPTRSKFLKYGRQGKEGRWTINEE